MHTCVASFEKNNAGSELAQLGKDDLDCKINLPRVSLNTKDPGLGESEKRWNSFEGRWLAGSVGMTVPAKR